MGIRFRKSIKLGDLVKLNISKSGISATVGKSGASLNIGKSGVYTNINPSVVGVKGTGVSYRKKLFSNPLKANKEIKKNKEVEEEIINNNDSVVCVHKVADNVLNKDEFSKLKDIDNIDLLIKGDEDIIEKEIGIFLNHLNLDYPVSCNFELEDHILYVDLDLPEIELFRANNINLNKEEYGKTLINLGIYLSACFFNISSYIEEIVISGFISRRNKDGDLIDEYIYSIKYQRNIFEETDLKDLNDTYNFMLKFENRINMSDYSFKTIKPYTLSINDKVFEDVALALEKLGYKSKDINAIMPELKKMNLSLESDYIKEALKLLHH